jgi:hypothetical protein
MLRTSTLKEFAVEENHVPSAKAEPETPIALPKTTQNESKIRVR